MAYQSTFTGAQVDARLTLANTALQPASIDTLAKLNAILSDATLMDSGLVPFPATPTSTGTPGQVAFDATSGQLAYCVDTDVWRYLITAAEPF